MLAETPGRSGLKVGRRSEGEFGRLRDWGIPETDLPAIAAATVERSGAKANPRRASVAEVEQLLHNIY